MAHKHAGDYLRTAGGPNRNADKRQIFIIRADGSVVSRQYLDHTLWTDDKFEREVMYPGDTIVVPEQLNKTTLLARLDGLVGGVLAVCPWSGGDPGDQVAGDVNRAAQRNWRVADVKDCQCCDSTNRST